MNMRDQLVKYERILLYSVIHYTDQPKELIFSALAHLAPGGMLLIGDIPNISRKGRFLATEHGRIFVPRFSYAQCAFIFSPYG